MVGGTSHPKILVFFDMYRSVFLFASTALFIATNSNPALASEDFLSLRDASGTIVATFSQSEAEALGTYEVTTTTPWTKGDVTFTGVKGQHLLETAGFSDVDLTAIALDDYAALLTWADIVDRNAIFATRMNGEPLTLDRKGPFWVIFDFDEIPSSKRSEMHSKAVWHLVEIEIE